MAKTCEAIWCRRQFSLRWDFNFCFLFISSFSDLPTQQHYREPLVATNVIVKEAFVSRKLSLVVKVGMGEYFGKDFRKPQKSQLLPQPRLLPYPPMTQGGWSTSPKHSTFANFLRNLALVSKHVKVKRFNFCTFDPVIMSFISYFTLPSYLN